MTPVAERRILRVLAAAPGHRFLLADFHFDRREAGAFVGAVAERLRLRTAARTPPIKTRTCLRDEGRFLRNLWFSHDSDRSGAPAGQPPQARFCSPLTNVNPVAQHISCLPQPGVARPEVLAVFPGAAIP